MSHPTEPLVALDLGSSRTRVLVAEVFPGEEEILPVRFRGFGEVESGGWRKGTIASLEQVAASVRKAAELAEEMAGVAGESAVVGIGGPHTQGFSTRADLTLSARPREVTRADVRRVMEPARRVPLPPNREILHLIPREFTLDSQDGIRDPIGLYGSRLEAQVHILTGSVAATQNVVTAVNHAGILVETMVAESLATGEAVLTPEERELGAVVAVVGSESCELVAYRHGGLHMSASLPVGGEYFTYDLAVGLHTPVSDAEIIKKTFGSVFPSGGHEGSLFEVPGVGDRPSRQVSRRELLAILGPRAQELLGLILGETRRWGMDRQLGAGVILAGGGARLQGLCDLVEQVFSAPARLALPPKIADLSETLDSPEYATVISLLLYGYRAHRMRAAQNRASARGWRHLLARKSREGDG